MQYASGTRRPHLRNSWPSTWCMGRLPTPAAHPFWPLLLSCSFRKSWCLAFICCRSSRDEHLHTSSFFNFHSYPRQGAKNFFAKFGPHIQYLQVEIWHKNKLLEKCKPMFDTELAAFGLQPVTNFPHGDDYFYERPAASFLELGV